MRNYGDLADRVVIRDVEAHDRVAGFVVCSGPSLRFRGLYPAPLEPEGELVERLLEVVPRDLLRPLAGGEQRRLTHQVGELCPNSRRWRALWLRGLTSELSGGAQMYPQDLLTAADIG